MITVIIMREVTH